MRLILQLMRPFSIKGVNSGSRWRLRRPVVLALYAAVFAFGFVLASPIARLGATLGLGLVVNDVVTVTAIIASMLLMMFLFDRFVAGRMVLSPRLVRVLFTEERPRDSDSAQIIQFAPSRGPDAG